MRRLDLKIVIILIFKNLVPRMVELILERSNYFNRAMFVPRINNKIKSSSILLNSLTVIYNFV